MSRSLLWEVVVDPNDHLGWMADSPDYAIHPISLPAGTVCLADAALTLG